MILRRRDGTTILDDDYTTVSDSVSAQVRGRWSLANIDLSGADLSGARLLGARLSGANLSGANLSGADLTGANLIKADLTGANLMKANLTRANLTDALVFNAICTDTNFSGADLHGIDLTLCRGHISLDQAQALLASRSARQRYEKLGKVTGVGITRVEGEYAVKVNLSEPIKPGTEFPTDLDGVPVRVEVTGAIRARNAVK